MDDPGGEAAKRRLNKPLPDDFKVKIITIGDKSVGKSCCINRFFIGEFSESNMATLGVASSSKKIELFEKSVKL